MAVTRDLCFFQQAGESLRDEAFSHEWRDDPSSHFKPDARFEMGLSMVKGHKSDFLAGLLAEMEINMPENLPGSSLPTSYLIDAMSFIQGYQHLGARTFGNLVECYMKHLLRNVPPGCMWIHVVGDQYGFPSQKSLKEDERVIRKNMTGPQFESAENIMLPEWKSFISNSHNKENLLNFFSQTVCDKKESVILPDINIVLGGTFIRSKRTVQLSRTTEATFMSCTAVIMRRQTHV